jgi:hypothetical protein
MRKSNERALLCLGQQLRTNTIYNVVPNERTAHIELPFRIDAYTCRNWKAGVQVRPPMRVGVRVLFQIALTTQKKAERAATVINAIGALNHCCVSATMCFACAVGQLMTSTFRNRVGAYVFQDKHRPALLPSFPSLSAFSAPIRFGFFHVRPRRRFPRLAWP